MTKEEFIVFLEEIGAHYKIPEEQNTDRVYVYGAPEMLDDPIFIGNKMKFTPYLRVSHFEEYPDQLYTRDCGLCDYQTIDWVKNKCIELTESFKES